MRRRKVLAIIYKEEKKQKKFLILHRKLRWVGWECVKETIEENETEEQAVHRGIREETGIQKMHIEKSKPVDILLADGSHIERAFLVQVSPKEKIDLSTEIEHDGYRWVSKEEAEKQLTYQNIREILNKIETGN